MIGHSDDCFFCTFPKELPRVVNVGGVGDPCVTPCAAPPWGQFPPWNKDPQLCLLAFARKATSCSHSVPLSLSSSVMHAGLDILGFVTSVSISKATLSTFYFSMKYFGGGCPHLSSYHCTRKNDEAMDLLLSYPCQRRSCGWKIKSPS